ncbi:MAG: histidinol-phosphatase family, partial [Solirubrobacteraceae bacterium]|nr:histidinol-phosphatase family [Solirubrobacteraceae bacterium]
MLTDYHVHLRPDEPDTTAERYFTPANAERYRTVASERGITELGVSEHVHRFHAALDVWDHPFWCQTAADDLEEYVQFVREETDLKLGIEADFVPGREDRMANLLEPYDWDYVIG